MSKTDRQTEQVEDLYRQAGPAVLGYLTRRAATPEEAADLFGEVLVVLWRRRRDLPPAGQDRLWLFVVARNVLANHRRQAVRHRQAAAALAEQLRAVGTTPTEHGSTLNLRAALDQLDPVDREIIQLSVWEEFTSAEIGTVLDLPAATVRTRLRRARLRLRHDLDLQDEDEQASRQPALTGPHHR
ncbi:RNA polymerase sigma factor [Microlunatus antarcticus]|uniref:RNA polymerase sigma-70 factor (ECF subfamily) n=1 Tax=Microlunatus antarcticus TaxID=53388 RepID=A0A7W5P7P6_9ACTN|nr:RNA polymerase sigma-70 factor (ECF subfamily) [Microlunatus antarcticus]